MVEAIFEMRQKLFGDLIRRVSNEVLLTLDLLRVEGYPLGILSNATSDVTRALAESGILGRVDAVGLSCDTGIMKPDPGAFLSVAARLGVEPGRILYIGDGMDDELLAARATGMIPIQALRFSDARIEGVGSVGFISEVLPALVPKRSHGSASS